MATYLEPRRTDDLYRPSSIINDIWTYIKDAKILLADLTGKNPNVFYELGLAHALAKPVILITELIGDIPFGLRALRVIEYEKNAPDWGTILAAKIESAIREVLSSPLAAVLPAFLNVSESNSDKTVTPHEREIIEIKQELDLLRREVMRQQDTTLLMEDRRSFARHFEDSALIRKYKDISDVNVKNNSSSSREMPRIGSIVLGDIKSVKTYDNIIEKISEHTGLSSAASATLLKQIVAASEGRKGDQEPAERIGDRTFIASDESQ
jgi:hypothetical protein